MPLYSVDLCCAGEVVSASLQALRRMRDDESLTSFDIDNRLPAPAVKGKRTMCSQLTGSVVLFTVGHNEDSMTPSKSLKRALLNILDRAMLEMETRFSRGNPDLIKAVNCLLPQSPSFLDVGMLSPLQKLTGITDSDRPCNEILVAKVMSPLLVQTSPQFANTYNILRQPFLSSIVCM